MRILLIVLSLFLMSMIWVISDEEPVWSDEFDVEGKVDELKWSFDLGNGCPDLCGWGNNEKQYYTSGQSNVRVENGYLTIEVHKTDSLPYTSARLISKHKGDWQYGKIEVRARLPKGKGTWPAIWMLPTDWEYGNWPKSGEIDVMEHVGYDQGRIHGTVHTESFNGASGTQKGKYLDLLDVTSTFHVYSIEWNEEGIAFFVDDMRYNYFANTGNGFNEWPFDKRFYLVLNIAVGGNWGGKEGVDDSIWPQRMEIDYVRVYQ